MKTLDKLAREEKLPLNGEIVSVECSTDKMPIKVPTYLFDLESRGYGNKYIINGAEMWVRSEFYGRELENNAVISDYGIVYCILHCRNIAQESG